MGRMKDSPLLRWTQRKNTETEGTKEESSKKKEKTRKWLHTDESLISGHKTYLVKFFGSTEVDESRGLEVVKEGIRKLKFTQQLKKCEGTKTPKVLLTVSVDGLGIQDPKSKTVLHHHPLQRISYCSDDKAEKKFFSFITSEPETSVHSCYVFASNKQAEEITLTIGQAFQLAYERHQLAKSAEPESEKVVRLERENLVIKKRMMDIASMLAKSKLDEYMVNNNIQQLGLVDNDSSKDLSKENCSALMEESMDSAVDTGSCMLMSFHQAPQPQLDTLNLDDLDDEDFDPRAGARGSSDALDFLGTPGFRNPRINSVSTPIYENLKPSLITHLTNTTNTSGDAGNVGGTPSLPSHPLS